MKGTKVSEHCLFSFEPSYVAKGLGTELVEKGLTKVLICKRKMRPVSNCTGTGSLSCTTRELLQIVVRLRVSSVSRARSSGERKSAERG